MRNAPYLLALFGAPACLVGVMFDSGSGNTTTPAGDY
jgi:hypothetical protein